MIIVRLDVPANSIHGWLASMRHFVAVVKSPAVLAGGACSGPAFIPPANFFRSPPPPGAGCAAGAAGAFLSRAGCASEREAPAVSAPAKVIVVRTSDRT